MNWAAERRLDYIDYRMATVGKLRRNDLMRTFGISAPQASADIARFQKRYRGAIVYSRRAKCYVAGRDYRSRRGWTDGAQIAMRCLFVSQHRMAWE